MKEKMVIAKNKYSLLKKLYNKNKIMIMSNKSLVGIRGLVKANIATIIYHHNIPKYLILTNNGHKFLESLFNQQRYTKDFYNKEKMTYLIGIMPVVIIFQIIVIISYLKSYPVNHLFNHVVFSIFHNTSVITNSTLSSYPLSKVMLAIFIIMIVTAIYNVVVSLILQSIDDYNYPIITQNQFLNEIHQFKNLHWNDNLINLFSIKQFKNQRR